MTKFQEERAKKLQELKGPAKMDYALANVPCRKCGNKAMHDFGRFSPKCTNCYRLDRLQSSIYDLLTLDISQVRFNIREILKTYKHG